MRLAQSWFKRFRSENFYVKDAPRSGRLIIAKVDEIIEKVDKIIEKKDVNRDSFIASSPISQSSFFKGG